MKDLLFTKTTMKPIFLGFFIILTISFMVGVWTKNEMEEQIKTWAKNHMSTIVNNRAALLEAKAKQQNNAISALALIIENNSKNSVKLFSDRQRLSTLFKTDICHFAKQNGFSDILIIDNNGNIIQTLKHLSDENQSINNKSDDNKKLSELFRTALVSPDSIRSGFFYYHPAKSWSGFVAHRISVTNEKQGVIIGAIDPKVFHEITSNTAGLGMSGEVIAAVKSSESTITFMTPPRFDDAAVYQTKVRPQIAPISQAVRGQSGIGTGIDRRNKETISAWQFMPILGWGIVAKMDQDELLSNWRQSALIIDILFSLSAIIISILLFLLYHRIASPIKKLTKGANALAHGNYDTTIKLKKDDEFSKLATTFNKMASRIKSDHDRLLSKKITLEEQTSEIERLNRILKMQVDQKSAQISRYLEVIDKNVITSSTDKNGVITSASTAFCLISGYPINELLGQKHSILRHPDMDKAIYIDMWQTITAGHTWRGELKNLARDGSTYWVKITISLDIENGSVIGYTSVKEDITDKKRMEELAITDSLTGLFNRRHFNAIIPEEINRARRNSTTIGLLVIDIDHFKRYNDTYGHQAGDEVIQKVALVLSENSKRAGDYAFRLGGEEFAIFFSALDKNQAMQFAQNVRESVFNQAIEHPKNGINKVVTISIGMSTCNELSEVTMESLYKEADIKLYSAKASGRNKVVG